MKISLSLSKYNDLICLLNLDGSTIDSLYVGKMKDYISYVEKALSWKDKEITKDLIDRIVNKGEKFNISKIRKTYNISFTEAGEIYTYLEQEKIIKTPFSERKPFKAQLNDEIIEVEINAPTDIEKDFLKCLKAYDDDLDDFVYKTAKDYILANKDLFTFDDDELVQLLIEDIKNKRVKKEDVNLAKIQRSCRVGFIKAKAIEMYLRHKDII